MPDRADQTDELDALGARVSAARSAVEARGETFYQGPSRVQLAAFPPKERWDDWVELDSRAWPKRTEHHYLLVPTTCFNCESACGLLAYVDRESGQVRKFEGNPEHPGSRGRNCAKGPATINQVTDPDRILYPLRRSGTRGSGSWERISWDEALDAIAARIRAAITEDRQNEIMVHIGRPGEDGFTERVLASWGVDGHNSHTNVCSSGGRTGYQFWMGADRPSPDYANADVIYLISAHLEAGHYFNPHAQRITSARSRGAKVIVLDTRLSNTATHADHWLSPVPGSEAAINLAVAQHLIATGRYDREFVRQWWNWAEYLQACHPRLPVTFEAFENVLAALYTEFTFEYAAAESGIEARVLAEVAEAVAGAGTRFAAHVWRSAAAGNLGGWQVARTLFLISALLGAVATEGGTFPNGLNKFVPVPIHTPPHPGVWQDLTWPLEYPLVQNEMSFLLPHFLAEGRGRLDTYFIRVYNPVWTNPDGLSWMEVLTDESKIGCFVALTPTWNESAYFADYILPMGHGPERHDTHSYEQYDGQWIAFRQPVLRAARERLGQTVTDSRQVNPGEVWEENEFWIELSWRIDPDGCTRHPPVSRVTRMPGREAHRRRVLRLDVRELRARPARTRRGRGPHPAAVDAPLRRLRDHIRTGSAAPAGGPSRGTQGRPSDPGRARLTPPRRSRSARISCPRAHQNPTARDAARSGSRWTGQYAGAFPPPPGGWSSTHQRSRTGGGPSMHCPATSRATCTRTGWRPGQLVLLSTFRLPTQIHTRSANAKWLDELAHTNPVWIHPSDAGRLGIARTGDLVRVETDIGHFVAKAWITEGIRPGVVACSHHMGRWRLEGQPGQRAMMATVDLRQGDDGWAMERRSPVAPYASSDPDTQRIWWSDTGVHQNLTFPVHPDPISGMHCWHQAVRVRPAEPGDHHGDIAVDTSRARAVYREWLRLTRPAAHGSPGALRRPRWLIRPLRPTASAYHVPAP